MTDKTPGSPDDDEQDAEGWLGSLFDPTGELPAQPPSAPVTPQAPGGVPRTPPPLFPPGGAPQPPAFPSAQPVQHSQPVPPVQQPPAFPQPPVQQPPAQQPPAPQPPMQQPQPAQPAAPHAPVPPAVAQPPVQPAAQPPGFTWGLSPASEALPPTPQQPQQPPQPPAQPPAQPAPSPSTSPPAPPAQPAPPAASWFEPDAPPPLDPAIAGTPHESQPPAEPMPFETAALPDVAPDARDAPAFWEPEPTQMMDAIDVPEPRLPAEPQPPAQPFGRSVFPEGTELLPRPAPDPVATAGAPAGETQQLSALDALFGESQFREYEGMVDPSQNPFARREVPLDPPGPGGPGGGPAGPGSAAPRAPGVSHLQRILLIALGSLLAVLALVGLFFLGMRLPDLFGPAPAVTAPSESPSPSASPVIAIGPVAPGDYHWDELLGGECLDPYSGPWQEDFTVVDCTIPHAAQMVRTGEFPIPETGPEPYPGEEALQSSGFAFCKARGIFSSAATKIKDARLEVSYPVVAEEWDAGNRRYYCFVSRTSGEPITGDITLPQPTPTPAPAG